MDLFVHHYKDTMLFLSEKVNVVYMNKCRVTLAFTGVGLLVVLTSLIGLLPNSG